MDINFEYISKIVVDFIWEMNTIVKEKYNIEIFDPNFGNFTLEKVKCTYDQVYYIIRYKAQFDIEELLCFYFENLSDFVKVNADKEMPAFVTLCYLYTSTHPKNITLKDIQFHIRTKCVNINDFKFQII